MAYIAQQKMVNKDVIGGEICSFVRNWRVNMRSLDSFLKEQSQFRNGRCDVNFLHGKDYDNIPRFCGRKNKANQSQFQKLAETASRGKGKRMF